jgi:CheY-specific phosphatase CheX
MGNTKKIQEMLMNSIFDVFEKMFFVFLEPCDEEMKYDMSASIEFAGSFKGNIRAYLSTGIANSMVENMLGLEAAEITDKTREDCAKESLNMIAGSFVHKLDAGTVFDLSIPTYKKESGRFGPESPGNINLLFDSDGLYLGISMKLEENKK